MSFLQNFHRQVVSSWSNLSPRQQIFWGICWAVLTGMLVYLFIISPWLKLQLKLDKEVPMLRADLAKMQLLANQIRALPAIGQRTVDTRQLISDLKQEFSQTSAAMSVPEVSEDGQQHLVLALDRADFNWTLGRLAVIQNKYRLRVISARFVRQSDLPGPVMVQISFELPSSE